MLVKSIEVVNRYISCFFQVNKRYSQIIFIKEYLHIVFGYYTKSFIEKPGDIYTFRIEVLDPDKMTFRFLSNGDTIGEFTLPPADVPVYKDLNYNLGGGLVSMTNTTKTGLYFIDYLAIEQR